MLAPPVKAARAPVAARALQARGRGSPHEPAGRPQNGVGNQAMLRLLAAQARREAGPGPDGAPPLVEAALRAPGRPLDAATRAYMEPRFGQDLGHIRLHTDALATASAEAVGARAYTVESHVVLGARAWAPHTLPGRRLLAHELVHAIQQTGGRGSPLLPGLGRSEILLARQPVDDERARAVAEAEATAARIDRELADAGKDDSGPGRDAAPPSPFFPGGFTDEMADALLRKAEARIELGSMALALAEKQARRRAFWDRNPSYNSSDAREAFDLDLYWDPKEEGYVRQPYVDAAEAVVRADPHAWDLYRSHLWDLTENRPVRKSRFKRAMDFVCEHTEPCASNIAQFRRDRESGMSRAEALNRGMARLAVMAELMALPGSGPSGPVEIGPRGAPAGGPPTVPAGEIAGPGALEKPAAPASKPLQASGSKPEGPSGPRPAPPKDPAVPEPIADEAPTSPVRRGGAEVGERVGEFRIYGEKGLEGPTFERRIFGLRSIHEPSTAIGVRPLLQLFKSLVAEARAAGATRLRIVGRVVRNENIFKMGQIAEKHGGTFERVDATTVVIEIPLQ